MAAIDYGALLRVNGEFINKNKNLFMDVSNTGYFLEKARYTDTDIYDKDIDIRSFYVYAGDENLLLTFYKGYFYVISSEKIIKEVSNVPFISETFYLEEVKIKVSHLDPDIQVEEDDIGTWKEYVKEHWVDATGEEKLSDLQNGFREYKRFIKRLKRKVSGRSAYKYRTNRWIAEWEHKSDKYEVIFGYGIDPNIFVWNDIKNEAYGFTKREIAVIDGWFSE